MKTKIIPIVMFVVTSLWSYSQTFHSDLWVDSKHTFSYDHGISREHLTFVIDLINLKISIHSEKTFQESKNIDLIHLDSRIAIEEDGQHFRKSKYQIGYNGDLFFYIEDYRTIHSNLLMDKYNKVFGLEVIKNGETTSLIAVYITEKETAIKYSPNTLWCQYQQSYISDYRVEVVGENKTGDTKRNKVLIEIDTVNHYSSINNQNGKRFSFIREGITDFLGSKWKLRKYRYEDSPGDFLTILETETPVKVEDVLYNKIFNLTTKDTATNKRISSTDLYVGNSPKKDEGQNQYFEKPDE